jgi:hypothetical protein
MHLFIEEEFLIDFEITFDENKSSTGQNILFRIFKEYTELKVHFDEYKELIKNDSRVFNLITDNQPDIEIVGSFENYFSENLSISDQTLILTKKTFPNKEYIESNGGICLNWDDYEDRLKSIIDNIHQEYLLSENEFHSWELLNKFSVLPINKIIVEDPYILSDTDNQKIISNLIPLISNLLVEQKCRCSLFIYTAKVINPFEAGKNIKLDEEIKKRHHLLLSRLTNNINQLVFLESNVSKKDYYQHDRYIYTSFGFISCGKGFNLFPMSLSNSSVICSTIFDKGTFKKHKAHIKKLKNIAEVLLIDDSIDNRFKIFPKNLKDIRLF